MDDSGVTVNQNADVLRITLTSDTIIRDPKSLGFHVQFSAEALCDALDLTDSGTTNVKQRRFSDSQRYIGFNAASGLPTAPKMAIRRGSTLAVEGPLATRLRGALRGKGAIGERQWEGCGRFVLDFAPPADTVGELAAVRSRGGRDAHLDRIGRREALLAAAELFASTCVVPADITRSQIGNLRGVTAALARDATFDVLETALKKYRARAVKRRNGDKWEKLFAGDDGLIPALESVCTAPGRVSEDADTFLRVLRRYTRRDEDTSGHATSEGSQTGTEAAK